MTYTLKGYDNWLLPPDPPTHWECTGCGEIFDGSDLNQIGKADIWYCDECYEEYYAACIVCGKTHAKSDMTASINSWVCEDCMDEYFPAFKVVKP